jgi:molybdopterin-guanine dinucleotide biosynthesis protein A
VNAADGVTGVILAGGSSRRMGRDKGSLPIDGRASLQRVAEAVSGVCAELVIASGPNPRLSLPGLRPIWVPDPPGTSGPLAGIVAGLQAASNQAVLVVACDMPLLRPEVLVDLLDLAHDCDAVIPRLAGTPQPLHAAYSRDCLSTARALLSLGARSLGELLARLRVRYVDDRHYRGLDPEGLSWFNMNTPDDYRFVLTSWLQRSARHVAA